MRKMLFSQVVDGFMLACEARRLSPHTIRDYQTTFGKFLAFAGNKELGAISPESVREFLAQQDEVSKKTLLNYHTGLAALWTWAVEMRLTTRHVLREVERPKPEKPAIKPFTEEEVRALLKATERTRCYTRAGQREFDRARPTADRDRAMIFLLLDTGLRASELAGLRIRDLNLKDRCCWVTGKGDKERQLYFSPETAKVLWLYLQSRPDAKMNEALFVTDEGDPVDRGRLLNLLKWLGERAGVRDCHPHRFRHTFAVNYLRNGGNVYTLQAMLGHTTLDMVKTYLHLAETDLKEAHQEASPVARWRLSVRK